MEITEQEINIVMGEAAGLLEAGDFVGAATIYHTLFTETNDWRFANEAGIYFQRANKFSEAEAAFKQAILITPDRNPVLRNLGLNHILAKEFVLAKEVFEEVLEKTNDPKAACELGWIEMQYKKWDEALAYFDIALVNDQMLNGYNMTGSSSLDSHMSSRVFLNKARIFGLELDRYEDACKMLDYLNEELQDIGRIFKFTKEAINRKKTEIATFAATLLLEDYDQYDDVKKLCDSLGVTPEESN